MNEPIHHSDDFAMGIGYCDAYFGEDTYPLLWKFWDHPTQRAFLKGRMSAKYVRYQQATTRFRSSATLFALGLMNPLSVGSKIRQR